MARRIDTLSPRSIRILYTMLAVLTLSLSVYNFLHVMVWRVHSNDQCEWQQVYSDTTQVYIDMIADGGSGDRAGLLAGDILIAVDGQSVSLSESARAALHSVEAGEAAVLKLKRDRRETTVLWRRDVDETTLPFIVYDRPDYTLIITNIVPGGVTEQAGARDGDILLRIDGVSVLNSYGAQYLINQHQAGSMASFTVERDGERMSYQVEMLKVFNFTYFARFLLGLGFLLVGYFVVMLRPEGGVQRKFARFGYFSLLFFAFTTLVLLPEVDPPWKIFSMLTVTSLVRILIPPTFLTFFLYFPYRHNVLDRKWFVPLLYVLSFVLAMPFVQYVFGLRLLGERWVLVANSLCYGFFVAGLLAFTISYFSERMRSRRKQLRPILNSVFIGMAAFTYLGVLGATYPLAVFLDPWLLLPALLIIGIPPAFGYSIIKHRLMDVTLIVKRSIIYGVVTMAVAMIYLVMVFGLGSLIGSILGQTENQVLTVVAFVIIALLFDPLKSRVQRWVDRVFYQERYSYQKALLQFSRDLPRTIQLDDVMSSIVHTISSTMHVERVGVGLCDEEIGCTLMARGIPEELCVLNTSTSPVVALLTREQSPISFEAPDELHATGLSEAELQRILDAGVVLIVPLLLQDRLIGAILVGPKKSGKLYSQEDTDLLATVAGQAAIAIENARLVKSEVEKQKYREQLAIARKIQQGLLPRGNPSVETLDISGVSIPAMSVGGDYHDYISLPGGRLLVLVADVAGKGMSAALYMARVQGLIRYAAHLYNSPKEILLSVNRHIYEGIERNSFVTMILALFDPENEKVTVCRAGHTQPLIASNGTVSFLGSEGMALGLEPGEIFDSSLEEVTIPLKEGSTYILYSDGLSEAMDAGQNEFGEERVREIVVATSGRAAQEVLDSLLEAVEKHRDQAQQHDDITLVVVRNDRQR